MALLLNILQHKPPTWDDTSYGNNRFVRIAVDEESAEYSEVAAEFSRSYSGQQIIKIERIQHPYAFARYRLRKEHLLKTDGYEPSEGRRLFWINSENVIQKILESNCDARTGGFSSSLFSSIYSSENSGYILVVKVLAADMNRRDTHRYPEYLIQYGNGNKSDLSDLHTRLKHLQLYSLDL